jgi:hypothetical protein
MPLNPGDVVRLFKKNIHASAQNKHFKNMPDGAFVLVKVKEIGVQGDGKQQKTTATVVPVLEMVPVGATSFIQRWINH